MSIISDTEPDIIKSNKKILEEKTMTNRNYHNIKKALSEAKSLKGIYDAAYVQISYDTVNDEVITNYHYDLGHGSQTIYDDENIINVGNVYEPTTMARIREMIDDALEARR